MKTIEIIEKAKSEGLITNTDIMMSTMNAGLFGIENINDLKNSNEFTQEKVLEALRSNYTNPKF